MRDATRLYVAAPFDTVMKHEDEAEWDFEDVKGVGRWLTCGNRAKGPDRSPCVIVQLVVRML
jgi:hypothetical protein